MGLLLFFLLLLLFSYFLWNVIDAPLMNERCYFIIRHYNFQWVRKFSYLITNKIVRFFCNVFFVVNSYNVFSYHNPIISQSPGAVKLEPLLLWTIFHPLILLKLLIFFQLLVGLGTRGFLVGPRKRGYMIFLVCSTFFPFVVMARAPRRPEPEIYFLACVSK